MQISIDAINVYWMSENLTPIIINLGTRWRWVHV